MRKNILNKLKYLPFLAVIQAPVGLAKTSDMGGTWNSLTLSGSLDKISPDLKKFHWLVFDQARTRDDSSDGMRLSENLLFGQIGYSLNQNASVWLGYTHNWLHPLDKPAYQESRPYEDFLWNSSLDDLKFTSRTRLEQRIREDTGNVGVRVRQMFQVNYPLKFIDKDLSVYAGDEVLCYLNENTFGRTGFSENRAFGGLSYQVTKHLGADLGYMGQFIDNKTANNVFTHNVQFNLRYQF